MASYPCALYDTWTKGCNHAYCQQCNRCNVCNNSSSNPSYCDTTQNTCKYQQTAKNLSVGPSGAPTASRDDIIIKIFPQAKMNQLIQWIIRAAKMGKEHTSPVPSIGTESRNFVYADKINEIIAGMITIDSANATATVKRD